MYVCMYIYICKSVSCIFIPQAKSLVSEFRNANHLINPVSLLKFDAVDIQSSKEGK